MQPELATRRALVLGGTGTVGSAVLKELARRGVPALFTFHRSEEKARVLALEHGHRAARVDLADAEVTHQWFAGLAANGVVPDVLIHCAARTASLPLEDIGPDVWRDTIAVNAQSAFLACQWVASMVPKTLTDRHVDVVLVGGLDRTQSLPLPVHLAASQGMLGAMVMAVAHELGPRGVRINQVALGLLRSGLSEGLSARQRKDFETFSALRRPGTAEEAARAIVWLALENSYLQGKVVPVNGGI